MDPLFKPAAIAAAFALGCGLLPLNTQADTGPQVGPLLPLVSNVVSAGPPIEWVAWAGNGQFVVSWVESSSDGSRHAMARTFDGTGAPISEPFEIQTPNADYSVEMAISSGGSVIAVWHEPGANPPRAFKPGAIHAQLYDTTGTPQGDEILVAGETAPTVGTLKVASDTAGDFAIAWSELNDWSLPTFTPLTLWMFESSRTYAKVYSATGQLKKSVMVDRVPQKVFKTSYYGGHFNCDLLEGMAMNGNGEIVLIYDVWRNNQQLAASAQRFNLNLNTKAPPTTLGGTAEGSKPVGIDAAGNFAVVIRDSQSSVLRAQRYSSDIKPLQATEAIATDDGQPAVDVALSMAPSGEFAITSDVVLVQQSSSTSYDWVYGKYGQFFNADATALTTNAAIDDGSGQDNLGHGLAAINSDGDLVDIWTADQHTGSLAIVGRLITAH